MWDKTTGCEFKPEFESGELEIKSKEALTRQKINGTIRKIHLYNHTDGMLFAMRFYDADGQMIYETAWKGAFTYPGVKQHEILL